jgi:hypothetical protein
LLAPADRKVQVVNVKVNKIKSTPLLKDLFDHYDVMGELIYALGIQAQRLRAYGNEIRAGQGIAAREKSDLMAETN